MLWHSTLLVAQILEELLDLSLIRLLSWCVVVEKAEELVSVDSIELPGLLVQVSGDVSALARLELAQDVLSSLLALATDEVPHVLEEHTEVVGKLVRLLRDLRLHSVRIGNVLKSNWGEALHKKRVHALNLKGVLLLRLGHWLRHLRSRALHVRLVVVGVVPEHVA